MIYVLYDGLVTLYESVVFVYWRKPVEYHLHHVVVLYAYGLALLTGEMQFWAAWNGMVELSNPCLCALKIMLITGRGRGSAPRAPTSTTTSTSLASTGSCPAVCSSSLSLRATSCANELEAGWP